MVGFAVAKMLRGDPDARILLIGLVSIFTVTIVEVLHNQGVVVTDGSDGRALYFGFLFFILSLVWIARRQIAANASELLKTTQELSERNASLEQTTIELKLATETAKQSERAKELSHERIRTLLAITRKMGLTDSAEEALSLALNQLFTEYTTATLGYRVEVTLYRWQDNTFEAKDESSVGMCRKFHFQWMDKHQALSIGCVEDSPLPTNFDPYLEVHDHIGFAAESGLEMVLTWNGRQLVGLKFPDSQELAQQELRYFEALGASLTVALVSIISHRGHKESLVRLVTLATEISDKLNSPLLVIMNAIARLRTKERAPDSQRVITFIEDAALAIEKLSKQLAGLRDVSEVEATKTFDKDYVHV